MRKSCKHSKGKNQKLRRRQIKTFPLRRKPLLIPELQRLRTMKNQSWRRRSKPMLPQRLKLLRNFREKNKNRKHSS